MRYVSALLCALAVAPITVQASLPANGSMQGPLIVDGTFGLFASIATRTPDSGAATELALPQAKTSSIPAGGALADCTRMRRRNSV